MRPTNKKVPEANATQIAPPVLSPSSSISMPMSIPKGDIIANIPMYTNSSQRGISCLRSAAPRAYAAKPWSDGKEEGGGGGEGARKVELIGDEDVKKITRPRHNAFSGLILDLNRKRRMFKCFGRGEQCEKLFGVM